ncbi:MAG: hypothetical protein QF724_09115 [Planctomycetota bacterium]|jgi:hypothetical protein|nr:hypothetical protein [Planctomycetota bacterium]MDP6839081.1 hypothetical protein [Planctomycetota bacterium]MDP6955811.1 hypothetical protein [Planctomycetota bacterium]
MTKNTTFLAAIVSLAGTLLPATAQDVTLSIGQLDKDAGTAQILFSNTVPVAGFQFDISAITLDGVCCGAAGAASFNISWNPANGRILAYGLGTTIPAGPERVLVDLAFHCEGSACDSGSQTCLTGEVFSDAAANSLTVDVGPCAPLNCEALSYCTTTPNSVGPGSVMGYSGSLGIAANDLTLQASGCPTNQFGIFFYGQNQIAMPFGNGVRCVGGQLFRFPPVPTGTGTASYGVDYTSPPQPAGQLTAYSTWNFQYWYRDPIAGGAFFNLSDGLAITFCQ